MSNLQVIILESSEIMREGIKNIVSRINREATFFFTVHETELFSFLRKHQNSLLILNINSADNWHRIAVTLLRNFKRIKLILIIPNPANPLLAQLIQLGIRSVISLTSSAKEIEDAIRSVLAGDTYLFGTEPIASHKAVLISAQEYKIINLLGKGKTSREIALELNKTSKTIETYRSRLLKKTGAKNSSELLCFFIRNNIYGLN